MSVIDIAARSAIASELRCGMTLFLSRCAGQNGEDAVLPRVGPSLSRWLEVAQVRRLLVLLSRHQIAVRAHEIVVLADPDVMIVLRTGVVVPDRIGHALIS